MELAKALVDRRLAVETEVLHARDQVLEHELVRGAAGDADEGIAVDENFLRMAIVRGREPRRAERRERVRGEHRGVALANDDDRGHYFILTLPT